MFLKHIPFILLFSLCVSAQGLVNPFSIEDEKEPVATETEKVQTQSPATESAEAEPEQTPTSEPEALEPPIPQLTSPVEDEAGLLKASQAQRLEAKIRSIYEKGGPQMQILIVDSLQGFSIEDYSIAAAEKWKIGEKEKGNGVIILMSKRDREVRIEVGSGAEGDLTDVESHQIIQYGMIPESKAGNFFAGFDTALSLISNEFGVTVKGGDLTPPKDIAKIRSSKKEMGKLVLPIIIFFVTFPLIVKLLGKNSLVRSVAGGAYLGALTFFLVGQLFFIVLAVIFGIFIGLIGPLNFLMVMLSSSGRGRYGGGGFGAGGGGWSGGGGGFSGGGASGSW